MDDDPTASARLCFKCGENETIKPDGILCQGCLNAIQAADPLGGRALQQSESSPAAG